MAEIDLYKILKLDFLGAGWQACYLKFRYLSIREMRDITELPVTAGKVQPEILDKIMALLKKKFVEGKIISNGGPVDIKAEEIEDLPAEILNKALEALVTGGEKKETN